jgi:hypothetical protein
MADDYATLQAMFGGLNQGASVEDITGFQNTIAANNIYRQIAKPVLGAQFNTSTWTPNQTIAATAAQAFLGSALNALGQRSESNQLESLAAALPSLYANPLSTPVPEGVDPMAFNTVRAQTLARGTAQNQVANQSAILDMFKSQVDAKAAVETEKNKALGKIQGENAAWEAANQLPAVGADGKVKAPKLTELNPNSPQYKITKDIVEMEDKAKNDLKGSKSFSSIDSILSVLPTLETMAMDNTGSSDTPFIYKFVQAQDGGVVKEGEVKLVGEGNSIIQRWMGDMNKALKGESALTPALKMQMVKEMKANGKAQWESFKQYAEPTLGTLEKRGGSRESALPWSSAAVDKILATPPPQVTLSPEQQAQAVALGSQLRAQGKSPAEIAATLRAKFNPLGSPLG